MLDLTPEDRVTGDNFWVEKGQIEIAMVGGYGRLQACLYRFYAWGEIRSDLIAPIGGSGQDLFDRRDAVNNMMTQDNHLSDWTDIYSAINQFNFIIENAPLVMAADRSFTQPELDLFMAEAKTLRALCYFYLARTFHEFPYLTEPSKDDEQEHRVVPIPGIQVLDSIVADLVWAESRARDNFDDVIFSTPDIKLRYEKGRVSKPVVWALLADVYLTINEYEKALEMLDKIIESNKFNLANSANTWFEIFFPGNSPEGIFELQFSREFQNSGDFIRWFSTNSAVRGEGWYQLQSTYRTSSFFHWVGDDLMNPIIDLRGTGGTFPFGFVITDFVPVWKWAGRDHGATRDTPRQRDANSNDPNWIFYRLADIYLMKAEAVNRLDRSDEALEILSMIRRRVNNNEEISVEGVELIEEFILDERYRELAFEGKRWFDMVRIARRRGTPDVIGDRLAIARERTILSEGPVRARIVDPQSWYFPIHRAEIERNPNLVQNTYYR